MSKLQGTLLASPREAQAPPLQQLLQIQISFMLLLPIITDMISVMRDRVISGLVLFCFSKEFLLTTAAASPAIGQTKQINP
jgi:hypothetical protein